MTRETPGAIRSLPGSGTPGGRSRSAPGSPPADPGQVAPPSSTSAWLWEWAKSIAIALVVWFLLRTFLVEAFRIPSGSMETTLLEGDFLFVNKAIYGAEVPLAHWRLPAYRQPWRGDILVFDSPETEGLKVVKRCLGLPGDTLWMEHGALYRNGAAVAEPYVQHIDLSRSEDAMNRARMRQWQLPHLVGRDPAQYSPDLQDWGPVVVPPDSLFMMGDNRENSYDGRYWGFLARKSVRGTPLIVYFSYEPKSWRPLPFLSAIRWGRLFTRPH